MMSKNCCLGLAEKPSTASVTSRRMVGSGVPVLISASMRWRVALFDLRQGARAAWRDRRGRRRSTETAVVSSVLRSCEVLGSAVSGQTEMHSMHWVQFSGM